MVEKKISWRWHLAAALIYAAESWLYLDHAAPLTKTVLGLGSDPSLIMWFLSYWPWAAAHHISSLQTHLLWQPVGLNLAWTTSVPLLALLALPFTLLGGSILAFNVLTLAAPALAAGAAYLLCLELFTVPAAALIGGWLFGFSSYEAAQTIDHLNLDFTCLLPLLLLAVVRRLRGKSGRAFSVVAFGLLLGAQFLICPEILATSALTGGMALALAFWLLAPRRAQLAALLLDFALAAPIALLLSSPILYAMLTGPFDVAHPPQWPHIFSTDLLNFILPTKTAAYGGALFHRFTKTFSGGLDEQAGYLGLPAIALLVIAYRNFWHCQEYRLLFIMLAAVLLASLGPELHIAGHATGIALPWALLQHLPLLGAALPSRMALYSSLLIAIILSGWVAARAERLRIIAGALVCLSLKPVWHPVSPSPALTIFSPRQCAGRAWPAPTPFAPAVWHFRQLLLLAGRKRFHLLTGWRLPRLSAAGLPSFPSRAGTFF
ncbi:hypothetical protein [Acidocella sp.]|uniref:hypothetical protein n=1 Tax=Acidocella sp. TaxID=50710 RepID=UPI0026107E46|nr:hypothetical protein [Acidocella sp.]MDD2795222.1 hypothetical protein [Acidocella sp.]